MLDIFESLNLPEEKLHAKFKILRDVLNLSGEQSIVKEWVRGFSDRDGKIVKEFQTSFHSSFWEFYLFAVFKEIGMTVDFSKNRPDFIITNPYEIYIEAVVSEIKQFGRKEKTRNLDDILSMVEPHAGGDEFKVFLNEAIARNSNSIIAKKEKYTNDYLRLDWVKKETPFVIALSSYSQVNYGKEFHYSLLALLYGYYFNPSTNSYDRLFDITKIGTTSKIPIGLFTNEKMKDVSAIIFSCTLTLGKLSALSKSSSNDFLDLNYVINIRHDCDEPNFKIQEVNSNSPEELSDGLFVFHNPYATNKLAFKLFGNSNAIQVSVENGSLKFKGNNLPIVSRLNISKNLFPYKLKNQFLSEIFHKFNPSFKSKKFKVLEINLLINPKEVTLLDQTTYLSVIIDLSKADIDLLERKDIKKNDVVFAIIKSQLNELGQTATWSLISIEKKK